MNIYGLISNEAPQTVNQDTVLCWHFEFISALSPGAISSEYNVKFNSTAHKHALNRFRHFKLCDQMAKKQKILRSIPNSVE